MFAAVKRFDRAHPNSGIQIAFVSHGNLPKVRGQGTS
jgi:hypothetical protein